MNGRDKCAERIFLGIPGRMFLDCPNRPTRYRKGRWYCAECFRPLKAKTNERRTSQR